MITPSEMGPARGKAAAPLGAQRGVVSLAVPSGEATRERILQLADDLFAEHGYPRVSMRMVAVAAGVTKPALYYHFRSKDALFEECLLAAQRRLGERLRLATAVGGNLRERIVSVSTVLLGETRHHPVRMESDIAEHLDDAARRRLAQGFVEQVMAPITALLAEAVKTGEVRAGTDPAMASAALLGLAMAFLPGPLRDEAGARRAGFGGVAAVDPAVAAPLVAAMVLDGLAG